MTVAAVIPAAGRSERMGVPKLLLELNGRRVIEIVVTALREGGLGPVVVVAPERSRPECAEIEAFARSAGAMVVIPERHPPDMRASIEHGLGALAGLELAGVAICPGDTPGVRAEHVRVIRAVFEENPGSIVIPIADGTRAHPVILPWDLAVTIPRLPGGVGVNHLREANAERVRFVPVDAPALALDLDTPDDWERWSRR